MIGTLGLDRLAEYHRRYPSDIENKVIRVMSKTVYKDDYSFKVAVDPPRAIIDILIISKKIAIFIIKQRDKFNYDKTKTQLENNGYGVIYFVEEEMKGQPIIKYIKNKLRGDKEYE